MRILDGEQVLVRIFVGESDRWRHQPLSSALLERLRREGYAGATVFQGVAGFGARSVLHTAHLLRLSEDLPVVIEIVDTQEHVDRLVPILDEMVAEGLVTMEKVRLVPILDEMVAEGLVTMEKVRVIKYAAGTRPLDKKA